MNDMKQLERLISASVSPYHCIMTAAASLDGAGFTELSLSGSWKLEQGHSYYIKAYDSTLIAFTIGELADQAPKLKLAASHTDWPCLKLKPSPEVTSGRYGKLNTEVYGGPLLHTWFDRPLSMAGKVCVTSDAPAGTKTIFVDFKRPVLTIPNLAIHMNREANQGVAVNPQIDMLPLLTLIKSDLEKEDFFLKVLACLSGIMNSTAGHEIHVIALYDNEEIGSSTKQGAASLLMDRVLEKLFLSLGCSREAYLNALFDGFMLSLDVAHAIHPNHSEKCDIKNQILMGDGVAIKLSASQSYATDATSTGMIESICRNANIPYRKFSNRSDMKGGSTLGSISSSYLTMRTVDAGIPMLAMHSAREVMGTADQKALVDLVTAYFNA